ncbi:hypothetical protein CLS_03550 [[Clostridium] cf. saccharolyticum K10]|nr:hypothetical protein CLS_03550 [[Clostridium] cf. saccharolyticum K10]
MVIASKKNQFYYIIGIPVCAIWDFQKALGSLKKHLTFSPSPYTLSFVKKR